MKLQKNAVCVFIEYEEQLEEAKDILEMAGEVYTDSKMLGGLSSSKKMNYLQLDEGSNEWILFLEGYLRVIKLNELETILYQ